MDEMINQLTLQTAQASLKAAEIQYWSNISTIVSAIATVGLSLLTWNYVTATKLMVEEMKNTREETFRPYVVISYEQEEHSVYLVIQNVGNTSAHNVIIDFEHPVKNIVNEQLDTLFSSDAIPTLVPQWKYKTYINESGNLDESNGYVLKQNVNVSYNSPSGNQYTDNFILSFELAKALRWIDSSDSEKNSLKSIAKNIEFVGNLANKANGKI